MTDLSTLDQLLDRPVAYHPVFADLTGSVEAAVMLSQAVYWQRRCRSKDAYWYTSREDWYDQTRLGRYAQEQARSALRKHHSWWHEERRGVPARLYYRVDLRALLAEIAQMADGLPSSRQRLRQQVGTPSASQPAEGVPTNTETTRDSVETTTTGGGDDELMWPAQLTRETRKACERELAMCPQDRRADVVHELAARLRRRDLEPVRLPQMWVRSLAAAATAGTLARFAPAAPLSAEQRAAIESDYQRRLQASRTRGARELGLAAREG